MSTARKLIVILSGGFPAPTLDTPANAALLTDTTPDLTWIAVPGAATYTVQIATDALFVTIVATDTAVVGTTYTPSALDPINTYYWRVKANPNGEWSVTRSFSYTLQTFLTSLGAAVRGYYDRDLSDYFQDSAGTTPAAVGEMVGYWEDLSGNGNHALQAGVDTLKPTRRATGVEFDGGDFLAANGLAATFSGTDLAYSVVVRLDSTVAVTTKTIFGVGRAASDTPINPQAYIATNDRAAAQRRDDGNTLVSQAHTSAVPAGFYSYIYNFAGTVGRIYVNGGDTTTPTASNLGAITVDRVSIGALTRTSTASFLTGIISHLIVLNRVLTDPERLKLESFLV